MCDQKADLKNPKFEHESVAKDREELHIGVKGLSNLVIAGFPRNIFKYSIVYKKFLNGGRALLF
jgi:acyl-CoA hydrolase